MYDIYRETNVQTTRVKRFEQQDDPPLGDDHYYAIVWDDENPERGSLRLDYSDLGLWIRLNEPDYEESPEQVRIPPHMLAEAIGALTQVAVRAQAEEAARG